MVKKFSDLKYRTLINGSVTLLSILFILLSQHLYFRWLFIGSLIALILIALWEYYQFLPMKGLIPLSKLSLISSGLYLLLLFFSYQPWAESRLWTHLSLLVLVSIPFSFFLYFIFAAKEPLLNIASNTLGIAYVLLPMSAIVHIAYLFAQKGLSPSSSVWWVFYLIAVTKATDMGGYFIGGSYGRYRFVPRLSPNKTLEGAIGGLLFALLMSLLFFALSLYVYKENYLNLSWWSSVWLGLLIGVVAQLGDLAESLLKRDVQVKDSNVLPGVGGLLDMVDSLLFTSPLVYFFIIFRYNF